MLDRFRAGLKAFSMQFAGRVSSWGWSAFPNGVLPYRRVLHNDAADSSLVMACLKWIQRTFPEAPIRIQRIETDGTFTPLPLHPMIALLRKPNPYYSGRLMMRALAVDYWWNGNAYLLKERAAHGNPVRLWYAPHTVMEPRWPDDGSEFLSHYDYKPDPTKSAIRVDPADVIHLRADIDPQNIRKGRSALASLVREIFTDDEAGDFTASLLRNLGVPGVVISPDIEAGASKEDAERVKQTFNETFNGDKRGQAMVTMGKTKVQVLSFSPQQMDLTSLRRIPEERVTAVLGIPAVVVGLGAGLDHACVPAYARVQTPSGTKTVAEIEAGSIVWAFKDGQIVPRMVQHKWLAKRDVVYEIRTSNRVIRATGNHPLMVRVPGNSAGGNSGRHPEYEWREIDDLRVGDEIVSALSYPDQHGATLPDGRPATTDMLQFIGAIIGDGTVSPGVDVRIAMPPTDRCVAHYRDLAGSLFTRYESGGERPWRRAADGLTSQMVTLWQSGESYHAIGRQFGMNNATVRDRIVTATQPKPVQTQAVAVHQSERQFGFNSAQASRELAEWGLAGRAHTKRVPSWVFGLSRELRLAFLAGVVDTDGTVDKRGAMSLTFCNRALLEDVRDLMISVGIRCSNVLTITLSPDVLPNHGKQDEYTAYRFTASSAQQVAEIPFVDPLYRERVEANPTRHRGQGGDAHKAGLSADLGFAKIQSITPIGEDDVWDLTVEDGHSFFCENILAHNTYNNVGQAREAAYESAIIPEYSVFADEMWSQLLPDFEGTPEAFKVDFDLSGVRVLQEDESAKVTRENEKLASGAIMVSEYRSALGYPTDTSHDIYLRDLRKVAVPKGDTGAEEAALAAETHGGSAAVADETGKTPPKALTAIAAKDQRQAQYLEMVARGRDATRRKAQRDLETTFRTASRAVIANLEAVAAREPVMAGYSNGHGESKISVHFPNLNLHDIVPDGLVSGPLTHIFAGIADNIGSFISGAVNALLGTNAAAPDLTAQAIERAGLLDADTQARDAVKAAIADGTAAGDSLPELTARVGDYVAAAHLYPGITETDGLQAAVAYRADLIARTEEAIARAAATTEVSRELGITHVLISDGDGCGWTDHQDSDLADGSLRTIEEYDAYPLAHPNCQRAAVPWMEAPD